MTRSLEVQERGAVQTPREAGDDYGRSDMGRGESVQVEFVSADPTGPLSLDHGRGAVLGDVLASLLAFTGHAVTREFYVNDAGSQVDRFGASVEARFLQLLGQAVAVPEDGYHSPYVREIAERIRAREGDAIADLPGAERRGRFAALAGEEMRREQQETLARLGVRFDVWFRESELHRLGRVEEILDLLRDGGHTYEADGALWLRSTAFGDESDRPVRRSNGRPTYVAADLAYHLEKFHRGFDRVIDVWGADHDSYIARAKAGFAALNRAADRVEILIYQPVRFILDGAPRVGSRRAAEFVPLDDLIDAIGPDAARFFLLSTPPAVPLDLDVDMARRRSAENSLHALRELETRLAALASEAQARGLLPAPAPDADLLSRPAANAALHIVEQFPEAVQEAATARDPSQLALYAARLVTAFREFERETPLAGVALENAGTRLSLIYAGRVVAANLLRLMGIAPSG